LARRAGGFFTTTLRPATGQPMKSGASRLLRQ
jgi:hypothetical protein